MSNSHILIHEDDPLIDELRSHHVSGILPYTPEKGITPRTSLIIRDIFNDHLREYTFTELPLLVGKKHPKTLYDEILAVRLREGF